MAPPRSKAIRGCRGRARGLLLWLTLLGAAPAAAQQDLGPVRLSGEVEFGGRLVWGDEHNAKFQEYRDIQDGLIGSFDLLLEDSEIAHWLRARSENTGYEDQRYWLEGGRYGRYQLEFFYGELPHFFSNLAQTPYVNAGQNEFVLPVSLADRNLLEAQAGLGSIDPALLPFEPKNIQFEWTEGRAGGEYHLGESGLLRAGYRIQNKQGNQNWGMVFGSPGGRFISLPGRIDEQIHEVRVGTDWQREAASFTLEYLGNFYDDKLRSLTGDNPLVAPDTLTTNPDRGRAATPPSNWAQSLLFSSSVALPVEMPNRISGSFAYGFRYQNDAFLPHTINPRIMPPALPQDSLEGQVQTLLGNLQMTARPVPDLGVELRYRVYDYDNLTDSITFPAHVLNDVSVVAEPRTSLHNDYLRQDADLDVDWDFAESWTGGLGFGFEGWNRSDVREVRNLSEYGPNLDLDYRARDSVLLHFGYEFRVRDGSQYNTFAPIEQAFGFDCSGDPIPPECNGIKFSQLRKFDEANRYVNRFDLLGKIAPTQDLELTFTGNVGVADYHDTSFGLTEGQDWSVGADVFYQLHPRLSLLTYYTFQWQNYEQDSRYRPVVMGAVVDNPLNDWTSQTRYQYHNAEAIARFTLLPEKLDAEIGYLVQAGEESTDASGVPGGDAAGDAVDYPTVDDLLQAVSATLSWKFREDITLRAGYRYEDYNIDNFRDELIPASLVDARNDLYLGDVIGSYQAHVFIMSAALRF